MSSPERQMVKGASGRYHEQETGSNTATPHRPSLIPSLSCNHLPMRRIVPVKGHAGDETLGRSYLFVCSNSFLSDLSEAGLPRMASTVLRWAVKHHLFCQSRNPTHPKTRPTAQRYAVDPLPFVCLTPFPVKKMLKTALQSAFGRCKHLLRAENMTRNTFIFDSQA